MSCQIKNKNGEPKPFYEVGGNLYHSYKKALEAVEEGSTITVGFINSENVTTAKDQLEYSKSNSEVTLFGDKVKVQDGIFQEAIAVPVSFSKTSPEGIANSLIKEGLITENIVKEGDNIILTPEGTSRVEMSMNLLDLKEELKAHSENHGFIKRGETYVLTPTYGKIQVGELYLTEEEIQDRLDREDFSGITEPDLLRRRQMLIEESLGKPSLPTEVNYTNDTLVSEITQFLSRIGVSIESIASYKKKYAIKNGIEPDAVALADISNKVIAFKDGRITLDELTEETAHFIVEGWNQAEIGPLLGQIHETKEWAEHSEAYRAVYSKTYPAEKVEEVVRREVLGKFLANRLKSTENISEVEKSIYDRLISLLTNFFNRVFNNTSEATNVELESFSKKVKTLLRNQTLQEQIDTGNYSRTVLSPMYAISHSSKFYPIYNKATEAIIAIEKEINILQELTDTPAILRGTLEESKARLDKLDKEFDSLTEEQKEHRLVQSISGIFGIFDTKVKETERLSRLGGRPSPQDIQAYNILKSQLLPVIQSLASGINNDFFRKEKDRVLPIEKLDALRRLAIDSLQAYTEVSVTFEGIEMLDTDKQFLDDIEARSGKEERDKMEAQMKQEGRDISWFFKYFGQTILATNPYLKQLGKLIFDMTRKVTSSFITRAEPYMKDLAPYAKKLPGFIRGRYVWAHRDYTKVDEQRTRIQVEVIKNILGLKESVEELLESEWNASTIAAYIEENKLPFDVTDTVSRWRMDSRYEILKATVTSQSPIASQRQLRRAEIYRKLGVSPKIYQILTNISADYAKSADIEFAASSTAKFATPKDVTSITRRAYKSPYSEGEFIFEGMDSNAGLKEGLSMSMDVDSYDPTNKDQVMFGRDRVLIIDRSIATEEAIVAFEINKVDNESNDRRILAERALDKNAGADISKFGYKRDSNGKLIDIFNEKVLDTIAAGEVRIKKIYDQALASGMSKEALGIYMREAIIKYFDIELSDEYWDKLNENQGYNDLIESMLPRIEKSDEVRQALNIIRDLSIRRNSITKKYASSDNSLEILGNELSTIDKANIDTLSQMIREQNKIIRDILKEEELEAEVIDQDIFEIVPNQSFFRSVQTKGDFNSLTLAEKEAYVFSLISEDQKQEYKRYKRVVEKFNKGEVELKGRYETIYERYRGDETYTNFDDGEFVNYLLSMLPPYYSRMAPIGYNEFFNEVQRGFTDSFQRGSEVVISAMKKDSSILHRFPILREDMSIELRVEEFGREIVQGKEYFYEAIESAYEIEDRAERLIRIYESFLHVTGVDDYSLTADTLDQTFLDNFGIKMRPDGFLTPPTKNLDDFEALTKVLEIRSLALDNHDMLGKQNVFTYAMLPKSKTDRLKTDIKAGASYMVKDMIQYREDEEEAFMRSESRRIPKIGFTKIPLEDTSIDLFKIAFIDLYNSEVYSKRKETLESALSIQDSLSRTSVKGKAVKDSEIWAMFNNNIDNHIYGRQTSWNQEVNILGRKVDISKVLQTFRKFVQLHALGFSVPVALTSMSTAMINKSIQRFVNYHLYDKASNRANVEFTNLMSGSVRDVGQVYAESKLDKIMQLFGNYEITDRLNNAAFGYAERNILNINKLAFSVHQMGNFPVIPRVVLSKLMEYRVINGKFVSWSNFLTAQQTIDPTMKKRDIKAMFDAESKNSLYDFLLIGGRTPFDEARLEAAGILKNEDGQNMSAEEISEYLEKVYANVSSDISYNVTLYDGIIDESQKTEAQRHPIFAFVSMFKSWLSVAATRMFASGSYNVQTGNWEQGIFKTLGGSINEVMKDMRNNKVDPFTAGRKVYANMNPAQRANLRSLSFSIAAIGALVMLVAALVSLADSGDDDDDYVLQLAAFIATRTLNETFSSTIGVPNEMFGLLESPVSSSSTIKSAIDILSIGSLGHTVKRGNYEGWNKYTANLFKMTFLKNLYAISSAESIKSSRVGYTYFQKESSFHPLVLSDYLNATEE